MFGQKDEGAVRSLLSAQTDLVAIARQGEGAAFVDAISEAARIIDMQRIAAATQATFEALTDAECVTLANAATNRPDSAAVLLAALGEQQIARLRRAPYGAAVVRDLVQCASAADPYFLDHAIQSAWEALTPDDHLALASHIAQSGDPERSAVFLQHGARHLESLNRTNEGRMTLCALADHATRRGPPHDLTAVAAALAAWDALPQEARLRVLEGPYAPYAAAELLAGVGADRLSALVCDNDAARAAIDRLVRSVLPEPSYIPNALHASWDVLPEPAILDALRAVVSSANKHRENDAAWTLKLVGSRRIGRLRQNPDGESLVACMLRIASASRPWNVHAFVAAWEAMTSQEQINAIIAFSSRPDDAQIAIESLGERLLRAVAQSDRGAQAVHDLVHSAVTAAPASLIVAWTALTHDQRIALAQRIAHTPKAALDALMRAEDHHLATLGATEAGKNALYALARSAMRGDHPQTAYTAAMRTWNHLSSEMQSNLVSASVCDPWFWQWFRSDQADAFRAALRAESGERTIQTMVAAAMSDPDAASHAVIALWDILSRHDQSQLLHVASRDQFAYARTVEGLGDARLSQIDAGERPTSRHATPGEQSGIPQRRRT